MSKLQTCESTGTFHMENFRRRSRYAAVFAVLAAALFAILILNINTGTTNIPVSRILKIIFLREGADTEYNIIWKIRMPRILMAAILGGALSLSGFLLQTFFENPIAGPYLLGISSGAKMVVALAMIYFLEKWGKVSSYTLIIAAFAGSLIATGFILLVSRKIKHMATLLIAGTMIGYICSAITDFMVTFAEDSDIVNLHGWSQGSFSGMSWSNVKIAALIIVIAVALTFMLSKPIGAYQLGEAYAQSMGVYPQHTRMTGMVVTSLITAVAVSFFGVIAFVGLVVPHIVRKCIGDNEEFLIPGSAIFGGMFLLLCDTVARTILSPIILPVGILTSFLGVPLFLFLLTRKKR